MKLRSLLTLSLATAILASVSNSSLAEPRERPPGPPPPWRMHEALQTLSPTERAQFQAAHKAAMHDQSVVEARKNQEVAQKEWASTNKDALIQQDPSLAPILEKLEKARQIHRMPPPDANPGAQPPPPGADGPRRDLTPEEQQKLKAAHQAIKDQPAVQQAAVKRETAQKAFRDALHAALLKADPTIGPILDKVDAAMSEARPRGPGHKGPHGGPGHEPAPDSQPPAPPQ